MMINRLNRNRRISRILVVAIALGLVAGLFCGAGAAATSIAWSDYDGGQSGDMTITDAIGSTLCHKTTLTISQDATLDFGDAKTYVLTGSVSTSGCGGLVDCLYFSDASKVLTIKNLHITGSGTIASTAYGIGGLFGRIINTNGTLILENCSINGVTIGSSSSSYNVGGLVGRANSASLNIEMRNCTIENCNISSSGYYVGGLVGYASSASLNLSGCLVAFSNVTASSDSVGGLVGHAISANLNMSGCKVDRVYVSSGNYCVGGLVGFASSASVVNCANAIVNGSEIKAGSYNVGGLVGYAIFASLLNMSGCLVENCTVWSSSGYNVGGLVSYAISVSLLNMSGCLVENCTIWSSGSIHVGGLVGYASSASIGFIGDGCWVNNSWVSGTSSIGSLVGGSSTALSPLVAPQHSSVYSASSTTGSSAIANNDFDGIGTKEQYGSPIDRYGLVAGKDYGYRSPVTPGSTVYGVCIPSNISYYNATSSPRMVVEFNASGMSLNSSYFNLTTVVDEYTYFNAHYNLSFNYTNYAGSPSNYTISNDNRTITFNPQVNPLDSVTYFVFDGFPRGDVSLDGEVLANDAALIITNITGPLVLSDEQVFYGDITLDEEILANDASFIRAYSAGYLNANYVYSENETNQITDYAGGISPTDIGGFSIKISKKELVASGMNYTGYVEFTPRFDFPLNAFRAVIATDDPYVIIGDSNVTDGLFSHNWSITNGSYISKNINNTVHSITGIFDPSYVSLGSSSIFLTGNTTYKLAPFTVHLNATRTNMTVNFTFVSDSRGSYVTSYNGTSSVYKLNNGLGGNPYTLNTSILVIDSGTCGTNLTWVLTSDGTLTISGTGAMDDYSYNSSTGRSDAPWNSYYLNMTTLVLPDGLTTIGDWAFYGCSNFTGSLTIPNSVTTIGTDAFVACSGFTGSLMLSNNLTTIGYAAFYGCSGFTGSLTIPNSVTTIGSGAFYNCSGFTGYLTIPNSVTTIDHYAFYNCSGFTGSLTISNNVTTIGNKAFSGCSGFTGSLIIPNSVTTIGEFAFEYCSGFTGSLTISNNVTTIFNRAFYACSGFTGSLIIPNSVTTIGSGAFYNCSGFTGSLTISNNVTTIFNRTFYACSGITNVTIPSSVTSIGGYAFSDLHANSVIYAECSASFVSGTYSTDRTAFAAKGTNNAYTFTVNTTTFPSGFTLTSDNAPVKSNVTFEGWYASSSYSGSKVTKVTNGQTLYAKWMAPNTHQLSAGWNIVSDPHKPTAAYDTVGELFTGVDTADHSIYVYNGKTKVWEPATSSTAISPLNAYWVYAASPTVISFLYDTSSSTLPSMSVYSGWNLVGISAPESISAATVFTSVDWLEYHEWNASKQGYNPTLIKGGSGTAADTNNVSIWNGGWLSMNTNGTYTGSV